MKRARIYIDITPTGKTITRQREKLPEYTFGKAAFLSPDEFDFLHYGWLDLEMSFKRVKVYTCANKEWIEVKVVL